MHDLFHLVVETPDANLSAEMHRLLSTYTSRLNRRQQQIGHVFGRRYKAQVVDGSANGFLKTVYDYVHLNLVLACMFFTGRMLW